MYGLSKTLHQPYTNPTPGGYVKRMAKQREPKANAHLVEHLPAGQTGWCAHCQAHRRTWVHDALRLWKNCPRCGRPLADLRPAGVRDAERRRIEQIWYERWFKPAQNG